ncbi:DUF692 family multinuclear iron-containing protein [Paenibacillus sp. HJGM_3]|uniref:multinuclear nonheme iron-dependent oxidase n=1 Tax=Paenibacillus sp. HJGM_3 TaxID=3379816 RepID=UPI00385D3D46
MGMSKSKPLLACNYSPQLMELMEQNRVEVDWIKMGRWDVFPEEFAVARPVRPVLLHCLPHAGRASFDDIPWDALNAAIRDCGSPHIALHLMALATDWDTLPDSDEAVIERMVEGVMQWKAKMEVPLLLENVPYYGHRGTLRCATDPEVIASICDRCEVDLLLDVAHLRVSAWHRREEPDAYLRALPLHRVREIHTNGPFLDPDEGLRDRHFEMQDVDYELLREALTLTSPGFVSLEYGGTGPKMEWRSDIAALERQLVRLRQVVVS